MHYVSAEGLTKSYGIQPLFTNISFHINEGDRIALIARNGVGKSTLLNILSNKEHADEGFCRINKDVHLVLFEQDPNFQEEATVIDNLLLQDHPILNAIRNYELAMAAHDEDKIASALIEMEEKDAWGFESKVKSILTQLNIHHLEQPVKLLSGGQRKRVALAKTLIEVGFDNKHVLLLMDEPTNHLDVTMIEWLEYYLSQENITLLLVSHDRYFLEAVTDVIWELEPNQLYTYNGDYANYLEKKSARLDSEQATIDKAKNTYRKELEWMRKQPKARTTKSKSRQDRFYEIEAQAKQQIQEAKLQLQVKMSRLGGKIVEMKKVNKSYDALCLLHSFDYTFSKGERIGIIGKNGVGKSTFLQILQGLMEPDSGKVNIGDTVVFGNFSQEGLVYKNDVRVIEYVKDIAEHFPLASGGSLSASQFLELFLFSPEKQYTFLSALSGGEKKRLQLLAVLFNNPNFLILDEPTNDLDLPTLGVLEDFLLEYQGCVLLVSHDRYFMDKIVDHLFVFEGEGVIKDYPGNYTQYRLEEKLKEKTVEQVVEKKAEIEVKQKETKQQVKMSFKEKREWDEINNKMPLLEKEKENIVHAMQDGSISFEALNALSEKMTAITLELEHMELRWLELSEKQS